MIKNTFNKLKNFFKARRDFKNEYKDFYSSIPEKFKNRLEIKNIVFILAILLSFFSGLRFSSIITSYDDNSSSSSIIVDNNKHEVFKNDDGTYTGQTYIFGGEDSEEDNDLVGNTGYVSFTGDQVSPSTLSFTPSSSNAVTSSDFDCTYNFNGYHTYSYFYSIFTSIFPSIDFDSYTGDNLIYLVCSWKSNPNKGNNQFGYSYHFIYIEYDVSSTSFKFIYNYKISSSWSSSTVFTVPYSNRNSNSYISFYAGYFGVFYNFNYVLESSDNASINGVTYYVGSYNSNLVELFYKTYMIGGNIYEVNFKPYLVVEYVVDYFKLYTVVGGGVNSSTIYKYDYSFSFYYDWIEDEFDRYECDDSTKITLTGSEEYTLFSWYDTFSITLNTIFNVDSNGIIPGFRLKFEDIYDGHANPYILSFNYYASSFIPVANISLASQITPSCYFEFVNNGGDLLTAFYSSGGSTNANAYTAGYDEGYKFGYKDGNTIGEANGYEKGYKDANGNPIGDMIFAIADVPFKILQDFIGFNIMGFDVLQFVTGILGLLMAVFILKMFI